MDENGGPARLNDIAFCGSLPVSTPWASSTRQTTDKINNRSGIASPTPNDLYAYYYLGLQSFHFAAIWQQLQSANR